MLNLTTQSKAVNEAIFVGYTIIVPIICIFGIVGNIINLTILFQSNFKNKPPYMLLKALSVADLATTILEMLNGIAQGSLANQIGWKKYDIYVHLPVGSISTTLSTCALTVYTIERYLFVKHVHLARRYCKPKNTMKAIIILVIFSIAFNLPYFFTFDVDENGDIYATPFSKTSYFEIHDCVRLLVMALIPAIILTYINIVLMVTLHKALQRRKKLQLQNQYRVHNKMLVTVCLTTSIILFWIGEVPPYLTSRTSAPDLLYGGDEDKLSTVQYQIIRMISTILMCIHYSLNFFTYNSLDRVYSAVFRRLFCRTCDNITMVQTISAAVP